MLWYLMRDSLIRKAQEGSGGLGGENPRGLTKARPIFQQPFSLLELAQTLPGIASRAAGKSGKDFPAAPEFARKPFQKGISDSHGLLEFSDKMEEGLKISGAKAHSRIHDQSPLRVPGEPCCLKCKIARQCALSLQSWTSMPTATFHCSPL